ncbi:MAG: hypothetical protein HZB65_01330 [Candidatus Aenigmarchaeota archaeon]|nr:hypothetical protein [Candidatus Aenigmarchaeota archaeon]
MKGKTIAVSVIAAIALISGIAFASSQMTGAEMNDHHAQMHRGEAGAMNEMSGMHGNTMNSMSMEQMREMHNSMHGEDLTNEEFADHHASHSAGCSMME